jgi:hypothetical protein
MKKKSNYLHSIYNILLLIVLVSSAACTSTSPQPVKRPARPALPGQQSVKRPARPALPGQQFWKQGVSSYLFGTNDTYEWSTNNIQTQPKFQQALRAAGFTLIRTFFPDQASNSVILKRIQTIEKSGANCLGVITNINNIIFNERLVRYLGNRCQLYEFGNEEDLDNVPINSYLQQWNRTIPLLRKINPTARFIGPVTSDDQGKNNFMSDFLQGVKASGILPDAVSFHWYACENDSEENCLRKASSYGTAVSRVEARIQAILGKTLPIGISEWNYDPSNPPPSYGDDANFITKFSTEALSSMIRAGIAFACQFDAASYAGYGRLDMFNTKTNQSKPQYYAIKSVIQHYKMASHATQGPAPTP